MVFSSLVFLLGFLPALLLVYYLVPARFRGLRNLVLLGASLFFYWWGAGPLVLLMVLSISVNYVGGLLAGQRDRPRLAWAGLLFAVCAGLGLLAWFKYAGFLFVFKYLTFTLENLNLAGLNTPVPVIGLPIGISFFTFQGLSYVIDVYRGDAPIQKNPLDTALYVALFPQLVAGPIVRYTTVMEEIAHREETLSEFAAGATRFCFGLSKKMVLANSMGQIADGVFGQTAANLDPGLAWVGALAYTFQIYFDFSAYSDMAIGLGHTFGFHFLENFNYPYISRSVTEFWRRWHISLSSWFRDYVYIPLGGNRCSKPRWMFNLLVVWAATGIWHGASWNFIAWGLYYFVLLTIEKTFLLKYLKKGKVWPHIYTLFFVVLGWGIFTANQPGAPLGLLLQKLFVPQGGISPVYYLRNYGVLLVLGCVCSSALPHWLWEKISKNTVAKLLVFALLTALCVCYVVAATNATALYANF